MHVSEEPSGPSDFLTLLSMLLMPPECKSKWRHTAKSEFSTRGQDMPGKPTIAVNGTQGGRTFDGVGAVRGFQKRQLGLKEPIPATHKFCPEQLALEHLNQNSYP